MGKKKTAISNPDHTIYFFPLCTFLFHRILNRTYFAYQQRRIEIWYNNSTIDLFVPIKEEYGVSNSTYSRYGQELLKRLNLKSASQVRKLYPLKRLKREVVLATVSSIKKSSCGRPTYLSPDKETLIVATVDMRADASTPKKKK